MRADLDYIQRNKAALLAAINAAIEGRADDVEENEDGTACWSHQAAKEAVRLTDEANMTWEFSGWADTRHLVEVLAERTA